jgi:hypothetical protein
MLEHERYILCLFRDELREAAELAERLERALSNIEMVCPRPAIGTQQESRECNAKFAKFPRP